MRIKGSGREVARALARVTRNSSVRITNGLGPGRDLLIECYSLKHAERIARQQNRRERGCARVETRLVV